MHRKRFHSTHHRFAESLHSTLRCTTARATGITLCVLLVHSAYECCLPNLSRTHHPQLGLGFPCSLLCPLCPNASHSFLPKPLCDMLRGFSVMSSKSQFSHSRGLEHMWPQERTIALHCSILPAIFFYL